MPLASVGAMSSVTRPKGPLPSRVYWVRRGLLVIVLVFVVVGLVKLVGAVSGGDAAPGAAQGENVGRTVGAEPSPAALPSGLPTSAGSPAGSPTPTKRKTPLPQPEGECIPADVVVTPVVAKAQAGEDVVIRLEVRSLLSPACTFSVDADSVVLNIVALDDKGVAEKVWTNQECRSTTTAMTVVARQQKPGLATVTWDGRRSDSSCSNQPEFALPGSYTAEAIAVGAVTSQSTDFELGRAPVEIVTKFPDPTPSPTSSPSGAVEPDRTGR